MQHFYIDGTWKTATDDQALRSVINPADGSQITQVADAGIADVDAAVAAARAAFDDMSESSWRHTSTSDRAGLLRESARIIACESEALARIETLDTGKTLAESRDDIRAVIACFQYYADAALQDAGRVVDTGQVDAISRIVYEPIGVCSLIAPWNYPIMQMAWKVAPALVAGNTVVMKPSEVTPLSTIELVKIFERAGVPAGVVNLVLGDGPTVGHRMVEHPDVDMVSFTGGLETGKRIMATAAAGVKKVALELGGKNPNVVFADADFDVAVDQALNAAFLHCGQVCSAGTRLIIEASLRDAFVAELAQRTKHIRIGNGMDDGTEMGPLVSQQHRAKVESYIPRGLAEGATLVTGGKRPEGAAYDNGYFFLPTIFNHCTRDMVIVQEEIFGPVITVETFTTETDAIALANDTPYGLAGAVFTADASRAQRVAGRLRHGTVWINDYHPYLPQAEWGGFGQSGIGRELGPAGLQEYREAKHIWQNINPKPVRWFAGASK